jgi:general secretion pathway protein D
MHMIQTRPIARLHRLVMLVSLLLLALGCTLHKANKAFDEGRYDEAVVGYRQILRSDPSNTKARIGIRRASQRAAEAHLTLAREADMRGQQDLVLLEVRKALVLDQDNQIAQDWLMRLEQKLARDKAEADAAEDLELLKLKADQQNVLQLNPRTLDGIDLNFSRRTSLREIFATLSKASGVNIIAHSSFQDQSISIDLRGLPFQRVLDTLMLQNELFYKVIDKNTIMVFKVTPQNREQYENQILKTYYLSYAEPEPVRSILTTINPQLRVFPDKRLNAIIVKAKPLELAIVDQLIRNLDKAKAEVMVYLELMEVTENSLEQVGLLPVIQASDTQGTYRIGATTVNNTTGLNTNSGLVNLHRADIRVLFPNLALDALKSSGDARLVASPNVRVVSGETGEVNIGEKISTTQSQLSLPTGSTGTAAGAAASSLLGGVGQTSFSYEDVGVKIKVEPRVHNNGEIALKIDSAVTTLKSGSTPGRPDLGRREIKTSARLRDGETAIFGGLLKDEEQKSLQGIWGLSDIPFLGRLLGNTRNSKAKTDVILTIRAVLVRRPVLSEQDLNPFNPDDATAQAGPFTPKPVKKSAEPAIPKAPEPPVKTLPGGTGPTPMPPASAVPAPPPPSPDAIQDKKPPVPGEDPRPVTASDLVFFMSPVASDIRKGEKVQISLTVSGGKGLSSGSLDLRLPAGLRLVSLTPGDFLTGEAGSIEQFPGKDNSLRVVFKRNGAGVDSGLFAVLELEGLAAGNAPVLIQGGQFLAGANPISARWVNALVTVQ